MTKRVFLKLFLLIAILHFANAQNPLERGLPFITNYSPSIYKADPQNWSAATDSRGIAYFGNGSGVLEFDGTSFSIIPLSNGSAVRSLEANQSGFILVGGVNDLGRIAYSPDGKTSFLSYLNQLPDSVKAMGKVHKVFSNDKGDFFIADSLYYHFISDNFISVSRFNPMPVFAFKTEEDIFIYDRNRGLIEISGGNTIAIDIGKVFLQHGFIYFILPYGDDQFIVCQDDGMFIWNRGEDSLEPFPNELDDLLKSNYRYNAVSYGQNYAIATIFGGVYIMNRHGKTICQLNKHSGILNDAVYNVLPDADGNLWLMQESGLSYIETGSPFTIFDERMNLTGFGLSVHEDSANVYTGTLGGLFSLSKESLNSETGSLCNHFSVLEKASCWDITEYYNTAKNERYVLASTRPTGLMQVTENKSTTVIDKYDGTEFLQISRFENVIFYGRKNGFVALSVDEQKSTSQKIVFSKIDTFPEFDGKFITGLSSDRNDNIWLSTMFSGIASLSFLDDDMAEYKVQWFDTSSGLPSNTDNFVYYVWDQIMVGTSNGVYCMKEGVSSVEFSRNVRLGPDNEGVLVSELLEDKDGSLWIKSSEGLGLMREGDNWSTMETSPFSPIPENELYKVKIGLNGDLWLLLSDAVWKFSRSVNKDYKKPFNTLIRDVKCGKDSALFFGAFCSHAGLLLTDQPEVLVPNLAHEFNSVTFRYSAAEYEQPSQVRYSYRLLGYSDDWSDWTIDQKKEYTNLWEGQYVFQVRCENGYGSIGAIAEYRFTILPPLYRTLWAYAIYLLGLAAFIFLVVRLNSSRLKKAKFRLERIVAERTIEVMMQKEEILSQTEELKAQADLLEEVNKELEKLSIVARETHNSVLITDSSGTILWVNEAFTRLYGYTLQEFIDTVSDNIVDASSNPSIQEAIKECIHTKNPVVYASRTTNKQGNSIWVQTTLTPILLSDGSLDKLVAIDSDISQIKNTESELKMKNEQIVDSINYAKRIQRSILPSPVNLKSFFNGLFVIFLPKDIVSGDFYWHSRLNNLDLIAVVDCTGHGVPGGFMSMIGTTLLNEIVNQKGVTDPVKILRHMDHGIRTGIQQRDESEDGMAVSLCVIDRQNNSFKISCAGQTASIIQNHKIKRVEGGFFAVGDMVRAGNNVFVCDEYNLDSISGVYLYSDGFMDQFGGEQTKKFTLSRLESLISENHQREMDEQYGVFEKEFSSWKGNNVQIDDVLMLGFRP